jgi:hypothetical protein
MARSATPAALAAEIREHRVYFEVQRETAQVGENRMTVALQIWLWATVPKRAGSLPGAAGCRAALDALRAAAAESIARAEVAPPPDVEPFHWALYASRHVPDADEIRLEISLRAPPGVDGPEQARRERSLAALRRALAALGIFEGGWHPAPAAAPPAPPAAEPWVSRPAGSAFRWSLAPSHA